MPQFTMTKPGSRIGFVGDPNFDPLQLSPQKFDGLIKKISEMCDTTDPDLSAFQAHGGKLIANGNICTPTWCDLSSYTRPSMESPSCAWRLMIRISLDGRVRRGSAPPELPDLLLPPAKAGGNSVGSSAATKNR
jgi:hypothetical protein